MATCVVVPKSATSADVLEEGNRTRVGGSGLLCAIDGYPAKGCGDAAGQSAPASPSATSSDAAGAGDSGDHTSTYVAIGVGVLIALLFAVTMSLRRRNEGG